MRYFLLAGEKSGDQHGGELVKAIKNRDQKAILAAYGGSEIENAGASLLQSYHTMATMGLDFLTSLPKLLKLIKKCKNDILTFAPDALILIDFGGFNLRIAKWAHAQGIKCFYYIPPKTWAWNASRNKKLAKFIEEAYVILPFEEEYFRENGVNAKYVGNPTKEKLQIEIKEQEEETCALLPGSRVGEITRILPLMLQIISKFPEWKFTVAAISELPQELYLPFSNGKNISLVYDDTSSVLKASKIAIVTSGTATLETALLKIPQIVVYRASGFLYFVGRRFLKVKFISLVNLILDKKCVTEYIQDEYSEEGLFDELKELMKGGARKDQMLAGYNQMSELLGDEKASQNVAESIFINIEK